MIGASNSTQDVRFCTKSDFESQLSQKNVRKEMSFFLLTGCPFADTLDIKNVRLQKHTETVGLVVPDYRRADHRDLALLFGLLRLADRYGQHRRTAGFTVNALQFWS